MAFTAESVFAPQSKGNAMSNHAALDVSQEATAICAADEADRIVAESKISSCPD
jgi:hypothetical protein